MPEQHTVLGNEVEWPTGAPPRTLDGRILALAGPGEGTLRALAVNCSWQGGGAALAGTTVAIRVPPPTASGKCAGKLFSAPAPVRVAILRVTTTSDRNTSDPSDARIANITATVSRAMDRLSFGRISYEWNLLPTWFHS